MITSVRYHFVDDISRKNDVLVVNVPGPRLAAGVWTTLSQHYLVHARLACLRHVIERLHEYAPGWERWIVVGHRASQPNNRISRHQGIRKHLQRQGIVLPSSEFMEQAHECEGGLRFLGAARWEPPDIESMNAAMMAEQAVIVLARGIQARDILAAIVHRGWATTLAKPPSDVLEIARREPIVVIDTYGEFDDREVAVAAIGRGEILLMLGVGRDKE
jgi:hypothetical protein